MKVYFYKYVNKLLLVLTQLVVGFISLLVTYIMIVWFGMIVPVSYGTNGEKNIEIFVRSNGVHTDVCLPVESATFNWKTYIDTTDYPNNRQFKYISIGWGDKGFFLDTPTWADLSAKTALNAMFVPSSCAMHVEYMDQVPAESDMCSAEMISVEQYKGLIDYIDRYFLKQKEKIIFIPGTSYWGTDHFYEARGDYHMFNTCNSWTNGALKSARINTALYAMFPNTIMYYRKK